MIRVVLENSLKFFLSRVAKLLIISRLFSYWGAADVIIAGGMEVFFISHTQTASAIEMMPGRVSIFHGIFLLDYYFFCC